MLLGPNCLGVYDAAAELDLGTGEFAPGPIGLVSQSGNLALEVSLLAAEVGLGISRFASLGNQADLEAAELVAALAAHEGTRAIGLYCEDFRDGRAFARAAAAATGAGKPVLLLTGGSSAAGLRAARSHTGALVSESAAVDAACRAAGIVRVASPRELVERAQILLSASRPRGRRLAIVTDGGGSAVVAADLAAGLGLELPQLSEGLSAGLAAVMPPTATTTNPVDFAGAGEQDLRSYERIPRLLLESGEVDSVLLSGYIGGYSVTSETLRESETDAARGLARAAADTGRAVVVQTMYWQESPAAALRADGVPVYRDIEAALASLACAVRAGERPPAGVPELPAAAPPLAEAGYFEARALLAAGGVPFAEAIRAGTEEEALAAAEALGYPVVLKALGLLHKSDAGGVAVGLEDGAALAAALAGDGGAAGAARLRRGAHGRGAGRGRADRRLPRRPALRPRSPRRARRHPRRGAARHRGRARAGRRRRGRAPPARAAGCGAAHRCPRAAAARARGRGGGGRRALTRRRGAPRARRAGGEPAPRPSRRGRRARRARRLLRGRARLPA